MTTMTAQATQVYSVFVRATPEQMWDAITKPEFTQKYFYGSVIDSTYEPGASNTPHSHRDRPEVVYILSGKIIDYRGNIAKEYGPGESFTAGKDTTHWMENKGTVPAVLLVSTIAKKE